MTRGRAPCHTLFLKSGFDLGVVEVRQDKGGDDGDGKADTVDNGSSEPRKVREDECIDIDDDGEVNEECASASVAEKD